MTFDRIGSGKFRRFGRGHQIDRYPEEVPVDYGDFSGGVDMSRAREHLDPNTSPRGSDFYINDRSRLVRFPGTTQLEVLTPRLPIQMALHASLDNRSELILFDPPFIGVKGEGATVWTDIGLVGGRPFSWVNFGGTFIFNNRSGKIYVRQAGASTVEFTDLIPSATAYASFAGRVFAGGATIEGTHEPIGMRWSAANSNYLDWESLGAGDELLINDMAVGDRIVALRTMGLDFMAVLMRRSIWIARRTGLVARPADFQPRVPGVGAVNIATTKSTPYGVVFLSDSGVYLFDGNNAHLLSDQINADLLPLIDAGAAYTALYNPKDQHYTLFTPNGSFTYDMLKKRWLPLSIVPLAAVLFAEQFEATKWSEVVGTWGDLTETWAEFSPQEADELRVIYLGDEGADRVLAESDEASEMYFGGAVVPEWEFARSHHQFRNRLVSPVLLNLEYVGSGTIEVWLPNNQGVMELFRSVILPAVVEPTIRAIPIIHTGRGVGLELRNPAGRVEIVGAQLVVKRRGPRIEALP